MSVLLETSLGDIVIDLEVESCPNTCQNFLKLCKVYYYNLHAFFNVSKDFLAQTGDPSATGTGGESIWSFIGSQQGKQVPRYFSPEFVPRLKHKHKGTVSMAVAPALEGEKGGCGSQFFITLADNIDYLDGKHAVFGHVVEGLETLDKLNEVFVDQDGRPLKDVRIRHVEILDDPFPDPEGLTVPDTIPTKPPDNSTRIAEDEDPLATLPEEEAEAERRKQAARASALTLEMVGDLPFANVRPPENVLFVCKLNPVTRDEDLELIFSRFGPIMSCQVIRDKRTGDSLQYAFIEFDKREDAEQAYFKMQNVLVDDRRIWVDFSQSVARLNNTWSNEPKMGPRMTRGGKGKSGGFGGREDLEPTRRYREGSEEQRHSYAGVRGGPNQEREGAPGLLDTEMGNHMSAKDEGAATEIDRLGIGMTDDSIVYAVSCLPFIHARFAISCRFQLGFRLRVDKTTNVPAFFVPVVSSYHCNASRPITTDLAWFGTTLLSGKLKRDRWLPHLLTLTLMLSSLFNSPDADLVLRSASPQSVDFLVHRCILAAASPFFRHMFTLPQSTADATNPSPVVDVTESAATLEILLQFVYPIADPTIHSLDVLTGVLGAASKYDLTVPIVNLGKQLITSRFIKAEPIRVYAIASRFDLEEEAKIASRHTLSINIVDYPLSEEFKYITSDSYHRLLDLHRRRAQAAQELLKIPDNVKCILCNGTHYGVFLAPKWWKDFEERAREELRVRPTTDVIFEESFLEESARTGCEYCKRCVRDARGFLDALKERIDDLPATI